MYDKFLDLDFMTEDEKNLYYKCVAVSNVVMPRIESEMPDELKVKINEWAIRKITDLKIDYNNPEGVISSIIVLAKGALQIPEYVQFASPYFERHGINLLDYIKIVDLIFNHYYGNPV